MSQTYTRCLGTEAAPIPSIRVGPAVRSAAVFELLLEGALIWAAYSLLQIAWNGVILDQDITPAQVIAQAVRYPPGHPHDIFYNLTFNLWNYLGALFWHFEQGPWTISFVRNFLSLFLSAYVPYAATVVLFPNAALGLFASALTLSGVMLSYWEIYPLWVYPNFYSDGHIGLHVAVLIVLLLCAGAFRSGGYLWGLLPAIHGTMPLVAWPWALLYFASQRRWLPKRRLVISILLGLATCALLAGVMYLHNRHLAAPQPPYEAGLDSRNVYWEFTANADFHRRLPGLMTRGYLLNPVIFFAMFGLLLCPIRPDVRTGMSSRTWILALGTMVWIGCYGAWLIQVIYGRLPLPLEVAMPGRFSNVTALLLLPLTVAVLGDSLTALKGAARRILWVWIASLGVAEAWMFAVRHERSAGHLLFALWAAAVAVRLHGWREARRPAAAGIAAGAALAAALVITSNSRGALELVGLTLLLWIVLHSDKLRYAAGLWPAIRFSRFMMVALYASSLLSAGVILARMPSLTPAWDRWYQITAWDQSLDNWLASHSGSSDLILCPVWPRSEMQAKLNRPVLMETETLYLITYRPSLAGVIGGMARDLYGVDFLDRAQMAQLKGPQGITDFTMTDSIWEKRSTEEWGRLAAKYNFRYVLSPLRLNLPLALAGAKWNLYYTVP